MRRLVSVTAAATFAVALAAVPAGARPQSPDQSSGMAGGGHRAPVARPQIVAFDPATRTVYASSDSRDLAVIDASRCSAGLRSDCAHAVVATLPGVSDSGLVVDAADRTLYAAAFDAGTVTAIDIGRCNARVTAGCAGPHPRAQVGSTVLGLSLDPDTRTLYAGHADAYVSTVDTGACNGHADAGCAAPTTTIPTGPGPVVPSVDRATGTLYVPENGDDDGAGTTMAVFDASTCNASEHGCARLAEAATGAGPVQALIDGSTRTLYVTDSADDTVSIIDADRCNARMTAGCGQKPPSVQAGVRPGSGMAIDARSRTLYVGNDGSDYVSAIDLRHCRAHDTGGCARRSPTLATRPAPFWIALDSATGTLYVSEHVDGDVAALDARACSSVRDSGCRHEAPALALPQGSLAVAVDAAHHTLLSGANGGLTLVDTRACRARRVAGCDTAAETVPFDATIRESAVDAATHTVYLVDPDADRVLVVDTDACHAGHPGGCRALAAVGVGAVPVGAALNPRTHTFYTANVGDDTVSVIPGARCNAVTQAGCPAAARAVPAGAAPFFVAVEPRTDSVYVSDLAAGQTQLLDGAACDAAGPGCRVVATLPTGPNSLGLAVDGDTLYVAGHDDDEAPGRLIVADLRRCNVSDVSGCGGPFAAVETGREPWAVAVDPSTHAVYATNTGDASVSVIDGAACNALRHSGCDQVPPRVPTGDVPLDLALGAGTLYTSDAVSRQLSIIDAEEPCAQPVRCLR